MPDHLVSLIQPRHLIPYSAGDGAVGITNNQNFSSILRLDSREPGKTREHISAGGSASLQIIKDR